MNTPDHRQTFYCAVPLFFTLCACWTVLLVGAASVGDRTPTALRTESSEKPQTLQNQPGFAREIIQIFGTPFHEEQLAQGESVYTQCCAARHGAEGQGQFPAAPLEPDATGKIGAPPHNESGHTWHHSDVQLIRYVTEGGFSDPARYYTMQPFGAVLTDAQIQQVIAYIKSMWTNEQQMMQRQLTEDEQRLFSD